MSNYVDRLMARFGYVPASALEALAKPGSIPLKIEIDSTEVVATMDLLHRVISAAHEAEAAIQRVNIASGTAPSTGAAASGLPG